MCMYIHVCVCVFTYVFVCLCVCVCVCVCVCMRGSIRCGRTRCYGASVSQALSRSKTSMKAKVYMVGVIIMNKVVQVQDFEEYAIVCVCVYL
jgi:hypothetical protein